MCPGLTIETEATCKLHTDETKCNNAFTADRKQCFWGYVHDGSDNIDRLKRCHSYTLGGPDSYCRKEQELGVSSCNTLLCTTDETNTCTAKDRDDICNQLITIEEEKPVIKTRPACQSDALFGEFFFVTDTLGCSSKKSASQCVAGNTQADHRCFWLSDGGNTAMACVELAVHETESGELIAFNSGLSSDDVADTYCGTPEARAVNHLLCQQNSPALHDEGSYCARVAGPWRPACGHERVSYPSLDMALSGTDLSYDCTGSNGKECKNGQRVAAYVHEVAGKSKLVSYVATDYGTAGRQWTQMHGLSEKEYCEKLSAAVAPQTDNGHWLPLWICWVSTAGLYVLAGVVYGALWF